MRDLYVGKRVPDEMRNQVQRIRSAMPGQKIPCSETF